MSMSNLLGAASMIAMRLLFIIILIIVAMIVSSIVKKIVKKLLSLEFMDRFLSKFESEEISSSDDEMSIASLIGTIAYWLVFMLFLVPIFSLLGLNSFSIAIGSFLQSILEFIPSVIFAAIVIFLGFFVADLVRKIIYVVLYKTRVNELVQKVTFDDSVNIKFDISKVLSWVAYGLIVLSFITQGLEILGLSVLTNIATWVVAFVPEMLAALFIFIAAYILGNFLSGLISKTFNTKEMSVVSTVIKYFIWIMGLGLVLNQLGFDITLLNATYVIVLAAVSVALAISFGIGGIEIAKKILNKKFDKFDK